MPSDALSLSFEAVPKIGALAVCVILIIITAALFIVPGMQSAARARERRMQHEDQDEADKTAMLKEERLRFDEERKTQWGVWDQKQDHLIDLLQKAHTINLEILSLVRQLSQRRNS